MNFDLSEEQDMFRTSVERFAAPIDVEARRRLRASPGGYDRERWQQLADLGLISLAASEEAGGIGGSPTDIALVLDALGKANSPDPLLEHGILPSLLLDCGAAKGGEAISNALANVLSGKSIAALAWAERAQRYSLEPAHVKAESTGDGDVLTGEKTFVMGAQLADLFILTAVREGGTALYLVPADASGLEMRPYRLADGSIAGELKLTRVSIASEARLDCDASRFAAIVATMRLYAAAEMVGLGQRLFDDTLAYVKEREQFGAPIGSFQALQHRLVETYAAIEQSRSMLYRAALGDPEKTAEWAKGTAGAKAFIAENVDAAAREAVQMHGGMGITDELAIGHAMKRVMVLARLFGDTDTALSDYSQAA